ncbi:MAG: tetratricopeptide repeat protein [Elusimicrobiota bacterium]
MTALWAVVILALAFIPDQKLLRMKLLSVEAGVWLIGAWLLVRILRSRTWVRTPLDLPVALYAGSGLLFYALSPERGVSAAELTRMLFCAAAFFAATQTTKEVSRRVFSLWSVLAALLGVYALLQTQGGVGRLLVPQMDRPIATFGNPIFLAAYFACSLALTLSLRREGKSYWLLALLIAAGLWTTQSRAAVAGLAGAGLLAALLTLSGRKRWLAVGGMLLLGAASVWWFRDRQWTHGLIWRDTLSLWLSHPWLGCGLGRFHIEFPAYASEALRRLWPEQAVIINFAHNEYLQVLAETGIVGAALLAYVPTAAGLWFLRASPDSLAGGMVLAGAALLGQNAFSPDMRFGLSSFMLYCVLGFAVGRTSGRVQELSRGWIALPAALLLAWGHLALKPLFAYQALRRQQGFHVGPSEEIDKALASMEAKLAAGPADADKAENLAFLYAKVQRWPQAISRFELAAKLDPERPGPHNNLGNIHYTLGDREKAIEHWARSVEVKPEQRDAHLNLGKALYEVGRLKEAARHLQIVLSQDPSNEKAQMLLKKMVE